MKALTSMATRHLLAELLADHAVELTATGGVDAEQRVSGGKAVDLVFLSSAALTRLSASGAIDAETITPLVRSEVAVAVPSGSDEPAMRPTGTAFSDAQGVRDALRSAASVGYSTGPSGSALVRMVEQWGLADELGDRLRQAPPGVPVARLIAAGEVDLGFQQLSELVGEPGVRILGVLPGDCAIETTFSGAVATTAKEPDAARRILASLAAIDAEPAKRRHAFHPA